MKDYGKAIKILRKKNNLTQTDLARELSISGQAVSKWENNLAQPDFDTIVRITGIFKVTVDEFTQLCTTGTIAATPIVSESKPKEKATPRLIGVCTQCGRSIHNKEEVGARSPKLVCKRCIEENERLLREEQQKREQEALIEHNQQVSKFRRTFITPAIFAIALIIVEIIFASEFTGTWLLMGALLYLAMVQILWDNNFIADIFDFTFGKTFAQPGLIIPLSLDGFIWALGVKIVMAIIWFFLSLFVTLAGIAFCCICAPFSFVFMLKRTLNELKNNEFMPDTFSERFL